MAGGGTRRSAVDHRHARHGAERQPQAPGGGPIEGQCHGAADGVAGNVAPDVEHRLFIPGGEHEPASLHARLVEERQRRDEGFGERLGATADADVGAVDPQADAHGTGHRMERALGDDMRRDRHRAPFAEADERAGARRAAGATRGGDDSEAIARAGPGILRALADRGHRLLDGADADDRVLVGMAEEARRQRRGTQHGRLAQRPDPRRAAGEGRMDRDGAGEVGRRHARGPSPDGRSGRPANRLGGDLCLQDVEQITDRMDAVEELALDLDAEVTFDVEDEARHVE